MRLLFLGDVVGRAGRKAVLEGLPKLIARYKLDFVVVNGENAAGGFGITESVLRDFLDAGADAVTLGNHAFDQRDALVFIERQDRLREAELEQAAHIQQGLLPGAPPDLPGIDMAGFNAACRTVGGDYFDYLLTPDNRLAIAIGDVAGKGMPAALLMASLQARVTSLVESAVSTASLVRSLNRGLSSYCPRNRFITFFLAILDPATGELLYTNAGHNPTILMRRAGQVELLEDGGPVLAILPSFPYSEHRTQLRPGDLLFLYSDGLTEAENTEGQEFGENQLMSVLSANPTASAEALITAVRGAVQDWTGGRALADDLTMLAVRLAG